MKFQDVSPAIEELAGRYTYQKPPDALVSVQEAVATALRWLFNLLETFRITIPGLADTRSVSTVMQLILVGSGVLGALLLVWVVWFRLGHLRERSRLARRGASSTELVLDAAGWKREAEKLSASGQWRQACRALYLSLLRLLDERDIAAYAPTKTNYEYWYSLMPYPALQAPFRQLASAVEEVWFGHREAAGEQYRACQEQLSAAETAVAAVLPPGGGKAQGGL